MKSFKSHIPILIDLGDERTLTLGTKRLKFGEAVRLKAKIRTAQKQGEDVDPALLDEIVGECFGKHLVLKPHAIDFADETVTLRTPDDVLEFFGGDTHTILAICWRVALQNGIDPEKKILLQWVTAFSPSSDEPEKEALGPKPETTAESAENGASAETAGATVPETTTSGSTDPPEKTDAPSSRSKSARSVH